MFGTISRKDHLPRPRRVRRLLVLGLTLATLLATVPSRAATWQKIGDGTINLPMKTYWVHHTAYMAQDCPGEFWDGVDSTAIDLIPYRGQTLQIRYEGAGQAFGAPGLSVQIIYDGCLYPTPGGGGGSGRGVRDVNPRYKFTVAPDDHHLYLWFGGNAVDVRYSIHRCTSAVC